MPKQEDDIFKFDPKSFYQEKKINHEGVDYVPITNKNTGDAILVPVSMFENQKEEQVLTQVDKLYYQYNLFKNHLEPEQIKQTAQELKNNNELLNLISRQVAFDLINLYEHSLKFYLENAPEKLTHEIEKYTKNLDKEGNLIDIKLNLDAEQINKIVAQFQEDFATEFEKVQIWEEVAEELLTNHSVSAVERMQQDLGTEAFDKMSSDDRLETFFQYFNGEKSTDLSPELCLVLQRLTQRIVEDIAESLDFRNSNLADLEQILGFRQNDKNKPAPITESRLTNTILPIPSFAAFKSAITAQLRKDLWEKDHDGFAYFKHQAKGNSQNYIEHYISSPGDIELLPLEQAEQIIDKFGFNTVKLHLIFAAHTMKQDRPWDSKFSLKASDVIKYLGWDKRTDLPVHQKLNEIAKTAFVLDCLLVKSVWIEGRNKKGGIDASTPTGRMWNVTVDPRGEQNLEGKIEKPKEVYITVQPGLIFYNFLNKAGSQLQEALYQFGYLAQDILRIDPYHEELALRLAIHLAMDSRVHISGKYRVETLLKHLLPHTDIDTARSDKRKGYDLKQRWDNALKLLKELNWQIQFDESYPSWLQPGSKLKKPTDARKMKIIEWLLQAKITIYPPQPIPELLAAKVKPKLPSSKQKKKKIAVTGITSDQIRKGRNAKGWSQRKLAGWLGVTQTLVGYWEKGKRTPSEAMEIKLRQILEIID
jgi:DNA-binding transcriptional regulator YiaG